MATINGTSSKNGYGFYIVLTDTDVGTPVQNNSKVNYKLYIKNNGTRFSGTYTVTIKINGTNYGGSQSIDTTTVGLNEAYLVKSGTTSAITHNADGTKSVAVSASVSRSSYTSYDGGYMSLSGTFALKKINRYFSKTPILTYNDATETTMSFSWSTSETCSQAVLYRNGTAIQTKSNLNSTSGTFDTVLGLTAETAYQWYVKCTRKDSGLTSDSAIQSNMTYPYPSISSIEYTTITLPTPGTNATQNLRIHNPLNRTNITVYAKFEDEQGTEFGNIVTSETDISLTLNTNTMYAAIPNTTIGVVGYYCAYDDGTTIHNSRLVEGIFQTSASNCGPVTNSQNPNPTYANTNASHVALVDSDTIIQNQSSFMVTSQSINARGSSTIVKYYFKIGDGAYESQSVGDYQRADIKEYNIPISLSGNIIAYCYAEDSRGYTSEIKQVTMRVLPYAIPTATISASRGGYSTSGAITVAATRSELTTSSSSTDVNAWTGNDTVNRVSLSILPNDAHFAQNYIGNAGSFAATSVSISDLDLEKSYTITVNISDEISTVTKTFTIDKAIPILSIDAASSSVGINTHVNSSNAEGLHTKDVYTTGSIFVTKKAGVNSVIDIDNMDIIINEQQPSANHIHIHDDVYLDSDANLEVSGAISGNSLALDDELNVVGDANIGGDTAVTGNLSLDGNLNMAESGIAKLGHQSQIANSASSGSTWLSLFDGIVIEKGNNANGHYIKWGNGLMLCFIHELNITKTGSTSLGDASVYYGSATWTFPQAFVTPITCLVTARDNGSGVYGAEIDGNITTTSQKITAYGGNTDFKANAFAIGLWK